MPLLTSALFHLPSSFPVNFPTSFSLSTNPIADPHPTLSSSQPFKRPPRACSIIMSSALDMSLDDIIKNNKKPAGGGGRGRSRGSGAGPARRVPNRTSNRSAPYSTGKAPNSAWQHDKYVAQMGAFPTPAARASSIETGTKLYISNLEYGVSNEDIKELFAEIGDLKRYSINYDKSGRSKGTAEVVFSRRSDAFEAVKRYNNVLLDGKPMIIEIIGTNVPTPPAVPQFSNGAFGNANAASKSTGPGRGTSGWPRGGGRGRGRGRARGRGRNEPVSAAALDADLDKYHEEAM
ncbi:THO complex subunit 4A-like [Canna indica]|uniref:THO complex subunit 4A-like n=1 Tax=Canna indica TaxID=4628 RepID=A0AAQ3K3Y4_9LILI|nr:THO complex subunit 4A-like [Canna indica]